MIGAATIGVAWVWTLAAKYTGAEITTGLEGAAATTGLKGAATTSGFERAALTIDFATASLPKSGYILLIEAAYAWAETIAFLIGAAATIGWGRGGAQV